MIIGFTGTRNGMTDEQKKAVEDILKNISYEFDEAWLSAVHGDCIGADEDFHNICSLLGFRILIFPCTFENMRANCKGHSVAEPKPPMQRNRHILARAHRMIACPPNYVKIKSGSGTWATIGFTRKAKKPLYIVYPNGKVEKENMND